MRYLILIYEQNRRTRLPTNAAGEREATTAAYNAYTAMLAGAGRTTWPARHSSR